MADNSEEFEVFHPDNDKSNVNIPDNSKLLDGSPTVTTKICKVAVTPSSPISKMSSNGDSYLGTGGISQASSKSKLLDPLLTPVDTTGSSKFLYVKEKFRRPSFLLDIGCRTPKDGRPSSQRIGNLKKDLSLNVFAEQVPPTVPPNTPSPSGWRSPSALELFDSKIDINQNDNSLYGSDTSSQVTTKALASEPDNTIKTNVSNEPFLKIDKPRSLLPQDYNIDSSYTLNWSDHLSYLKPNRSVQPGLRLLGSNSIMKSLWYNRIQKPVQHHCFMSDITDVRQMEHALLQLLEDFHSGKLRAFAKDCSMEQMQGIREQQERLARLHFDLCAQQDLFAPLSEEGLLANQENMKKLMGSLEQLSLSIEKLQLFSKDVTQ
ncbi:hypothetical protein RUM44_013127 [Polyplax serrata]|uniref:Uncharacterized protein n=1 Tax=Polyplax serrata TaxID=468196 RepID=A0ABR1BD98_POLSC